MIKPEDLVGRRYGMLTVLSRLENRSNSVMWDCLCDCGKTSAVSGSNLKSGKTRSCGCQRVKHGKKGTRLYNIWGGMKARCYCPSHKWYKRYGGRGITVCDEWKDSFQAFYDWAISHGYSENLTIDRVDNDKGYYPDNCRWATKIAQTNNRYNNVKIEIIGKNQTVAEWAKEMGLGYQTLYRRYCRGERGIELIRPVVRKMKHE